MRLVEQPLRLVVEGVGHVLRAAQRRPRQLGPGELFLNRIRALDGEPMVDGPSRAGADAAQAGVAERRIDDVVPLVADRLRGTARLAGVAPNAGLGVDQMLPDRRRL